MRRVTLTLFFCFALGGLFYGIGLPPFRKTAAVDKPAQEKRSMPLAVEFGEIRLGSVDEMVSAVGSLVARRSVQVAPKISGRLTRVLVQTGDQVKAGQLIAQMDPRTFEEELREAEAALRVAEATLKGEQAGWYDLAKKRDRAKRLVDKQFVSREEFDTLESQRNAAVAQVDLARAKIAQMRSRLASVKLRLSEARLVAPFAGYVDKRLVDPGAIISAGTAIAGLVDIDPVKVVIPVVEKDYPKIAVGQTAQVICDAFGAQQFAGRVVRLAPVLRQETRSGEVEIEIANPTGRLKPGMFAKVELRVNRRRELLLAPDGALIKTPSGHGVYRMEEGAGESAKVQLVPVRIGVARDGHTEVQGALTAGDRVVTVGVHLLKDGQRVRVGGAKKAAGRHDS